jgi:hypothetical protein
MRTLMFVVLALTACSPLTESTSPSFAKAASASTLPGTAFRWSCTGTTCTFTASGVPSPQVENFEFLFPTPTGTTVVLNTNPTVFTYAASGTYTVSLKTFYRLTKGSINHGTPAWIQTDSVITVQ